MPHHRPLATGPRLFCLVLGVSLLAVAQAHRRAVPLGPKGRVIRDCEWRYRYANESDSVLDCKRCVKEFQLQFPPRRSDVVTMRQRCVKPYTPKEAANVLCHLLTSSTESRDACLRCIRDYDLPPNATKFQQREMDWSCAPHHPASQLLQSECRFRFHRDLENRTDCDKCVAESRIRDEASYAEFRKVQDDCITKPNPKERIKRLCKWRFIEEKWARECEQCIDEYELPSDYDYDDVADLRQRCMPRPSRKELLKKTCDWYYRGERVRVTTCEKCVERSDLRDDATYGEEAEVRSHCMPRKPARERVKDACPRRFRDPADVDNCRKCADNFESSHEENSVQSIDVQHLYRTCLSGNANYKAQLLQECQNELEEPEQVTKCQGCIQNRYHWRIPKDLIGEARKRCIFRLAHDA